MVEREKETVASRESAAYQRWRIIPHHSSGKAYNSAEPVGSFEHRHEPRTRLFVYVVYGKLFRRLDIERRNLRLAKGQSGQCDGCTRRNRYGQRCDGRTKAAYPKLRRNPI